MSVIQQVAALPSTRNRAEIGSTEAQLLERLSEAEAALSSTLSLLSTNTGLKESADVFKALAEKRKTQSRAYKTLSAFAELQAR